MLPRKESSSTNLLSERETRNSKRCLNSCMQNTSTSIACRTPTFPNTFSPKTVCRNSGKQFAGMWLQSLITASLWSSCFNVLEKFQNLKFRQPHQAEHQFTGSGGILPLIQALPMAEHGSLKGCLADRSPSKVADSGCAPTWREDGPILDSRSKPSTQKNSHFWSSFTGGRWGELSCLLTSAGFSESCL